MASLLSSYGYGSGSGDGYGSGSGSGYGYGYGYGYGSGSGYGSGDGYGDGYGYGEQVDLAGIEYEAEIIKPFSLLKIGCQTHTMKYWKVNWKQIAAANNLGIYDAIAQKAIAEVERLLSQ